jgi:hypothetical protein
MSTPAPASAISRIPYERAERNVHWLAKQLGLTIEPRHDGTAGDMGLSTVAVAGSMRRMRKDIGDIDLLAELPPCDGRGTQGDPLHDKLVEIFGDPKATEKNDLFTTPPSRHPASLVARVTGGLAIGFKKVTLEIDLPGKPDAPAGWAEPYTLKVEIHRYTAGMWGNRGWKEMIITGPGAGNDQEVGWGEMMLARWKRRNRGGRSHQSYPVYADGTREAVHTEKRAFELVGLNWIPPEDRTVILAKQLIDSGRTA